MRACRVIEERKYGPPSAPASAGIERRRRKILDLDRERAGAAGDLPSLQRHVPVGAVLFDDLHPNLAASRSERHPVGFCDPERSAGLAATADRRSESSRRGPSTSCRPVARMRASARQHLVHDRLGRPADQVRAAALAAGDAAVAKRRSRRPTAVTEWRSTRPLRRADTVVFVESSSPRRAPCREATSSRFLMRRTTPWPLR